MAKLIFLPAFFAGICLLPFTSAFAQQITDPASPYTLKAGGGLVYGTEIENAGLQLNGYYRLPANEQIFVGGDLTYFFPDSESFPGGSSSQRLLAININGQYHFYQENEIGAYGMGGLNYAMLRFSSEFDDIGDEFDVSETESEIGLNIGAGVEYELDFGLIYGEIKFVISDFDQLVIGAGVRLPFDM
ncbi:MAG: outer membrane beta-barrel protein [Balneolales bacterium]